MNRFDGTFVAVEGTDKSGKSTLIEKLRGELGSDWEFTQEPSNGKYGRILREELQKDNDPALSDFFLFCADRTDHLQSLICPKLDQGTNVLTDRYELSTYAYQSPVVRDEIVSRSGVEYIGNVFSEWSVRTDLTILVDVPVEVSMERMDGEREVYEREQRLREARETYLRFADERENISVVDGTQREDEVLSDALNAIESI